MINPNEYSRLFPVALFSSTWLSRSLLLDTLGFLATVPFVLSIFFILWQEDVLFPVIGGLFIGSIIFSKFNPLFGFLNITDVFIVNALTDNINIFILGILIEGLLLFSLLNRGGYLNTLRREFTKRALTRTRLEYIVSLSTFLIFIDRYLSSFLVGLFTKPFAEKKRLQPVKHAFLLNTLSTSFSPLIPFTTLTPVIITSIGTSFGVLGIGYAPLKAFYRSLPFQYYNIFSIFIAFSTILLDKELFFMRCYNGEPEKRTGQTDTLSFDMGLLTRKQMSLNRSLYATAGSLLLVFGVIATGFILKWQGHTQLHALKVESILKIFIGALFTGIIYIVLFSLITKTESYSNYKLKRKEISFSLLITFFYVILAMSIASLARKLDLSSSLLGVLFKKTPLISFFPLIFFLFSCFISFLCGSFLLTTTTVIPLAIRLISSSLPDPLMIEGVMFASVGAVISGASFGDINSPFSLNFIISAAAAETSVFGHFKSQIGYSLLAFLITIVFGYLLFAVGVKPYLSIASGLLVIGITFLFLYSEVPILKRIK